MKFANYSLNEMSVAWRNGRVSRDEMREYLAAWNAPSNGHFTYAFLRDDAIRNYEYREDGGLPLSVSAREKPPFYGVD